eukprot:3704875-Rhodomonas_salina.1
MNLNIKVFMAAYLVSYSPQFVFEEREGGMEKELSGLSVRMLDSFQRICDELRERAASEIDGELLMPFTTHYRECILSFRRWKIRDSQKLSERVTTALSAVFSAQKELEGKGPEAEEMRLKLQGDRELLRHKLLVLDGEEAQCTFKEAAGELGGPPPTQQSVQALVNETESVSMEGKANQSSELPGHMTNEQLSHELLLDRKFQMHEDGGAESENPAFAAERKVFQKAHWDSLLADLKLDLQVYVRVAATVNDLRVAILHMHASERPNKSLPYNPTGIKGVAGLEGGGVEWDSCLRFAQTMCEAIQGMQAPHRDAKSLSEWTKVLAALTEATGTTSLRQEAFCSSLHIAKCPEPFKSC